MNRACTTAKCVAADLRQHAFQPIHVSDGMIAANVYLMAAAAHLACWFHHCDRGCLAEKLGLKQSQRVLFAQTLGHPLNASDLEDSGQLD